MLKEMIMKRSGWMYLESRKSILLFSLFAFMILSCNDEDGRISLHYVENNLLELSYPSFDRYATSIIGGDGNYMVSCSDPAILDVELIYGQTVSFKSLSVGETVVTIKDGSNNSYAVDVHISYRTKKINISNLDVSIEGETLTEDMISELRQKALATIPVTENGGYWFVYTGEDGFTGEMLVFPEGVGKESIEGSFVQEKRESEQEYILAYKMNFGGRDRRFFIKQYNEDMLLRTSYVGPVAMYEDVTCLFHDEYPGLKAVHTLQLIKSGSD